MYEFIEGILESIHPTYIVVNAMGLGLRLYSPNPYYWQDKLQETVRCYVEFIVREDSQMLYGFRNYTERQLFQTLNKVSGIGPKSALSILAIDDYSGIVRAINNKDSQYLTRFPGVGKKTAQQMILDLHGKMDEFVVEDSTSPSIPVKESALVEEVVEALRGLGYTSREIQKIQPQLEAQSFPDTQSALSHAFKLLIK